MYIVCFDLTLRRYEKPYRSVLVGHSVHFEFLCTHLRMYDIVSSYSGPFLREVKVITFRVRIQGLCLKHRPTMFHIATVRPTRSGPRILYNTSLIPRI